MKKKTIWKIHSVLGLFCALGLLLIGLTGSVLVFHKEIARAWSPETLLVDTPDPRAEDRMPLPELIAQTEAQYDDFWLRGWLPRYGSEARDQAYFTRRGTDQWYIVYVDPYNGKLSGEPVRTDRTFYGWFVELHYTLFADHVGMAITSLFAIGFLGLSFTGVYIYRNFWNNFFRLRWRKSARIFFSDLHKTVGIASVPFNFILGFTGAYWNIAHLWHETFEHEHEEHAIEAPYPGDATARLEGFIADARDMWPNYALNYIYFPTAEDAHFYFYGQTPSANPLRSPYGSTIWMSTETGEVVYSRDLREAGLWAQTVDAFEPLHFGDFGGWLSKSLWCLAGLAPAILSGSGTFIWWKRRQATKINSATQRAPRSTSEALPSHV